MPGIYIRRQMTTLTETSPPARATRPHKRTRTLAVRLTRQERLAFARDSREAGVTEADLARYRLTFNWPAMRAVAGCECDACQALRKAGAR